MNSAFYFLLLSLQPQTFGKKILQHLFNYVYFICHQIHIFLIIIYSFNNFYLLQYITLSQVLRIRNDYIQRVIFCFEGLLIFIGGFLINYYSKKKEEMQLKRLKPIDQSSDYMEDLCKKNDTTVSSCGYITCALIQYLTELQHFNVQPSLTQINQHTLTPYIQKVINHLKKTRRLQIKKFYNQMNPSQRANYIKDWVANFQINDYLEYIKDKMLTRQVYFFRQCAYDHEEAMKDVKFEQAERIKEEMGFKGERLFYTRYFPQRANVSKDRFIDELRNTCDLSKPVFIATDVLGHFNVTVLFDGIVYVVDSLSTLATNFDQYIVEFMQTCYRKALQGKDC